MTHDDIIKLAQQLGWNLEHAETNRRLLEFAQKVANAEREACAKNCELRGEFHAAAAIRARGEGK